MSRREASWPRQIVNDLRKRSIVIKPSPFYSYCLVRRDLDWPQRSVQSGHAWWRMALHWQDYALDNSVRGSWLETNFVLIGVEDETELIVWKRRLREAEIRFELFEELRIGYTALATEPITGERRELFTGLRPLGANE